MRLKTKKSPENIRLENVEKFRRLASNLFERLPDYYFDSSFGAHSMLGFQDKEVKIRFIADYGAIIIFAEGSAYNTVEYKPNDANTPEDAFELLIVFISKYL